MSQVESPRRSSSVRHGVREKLEKSYTWTKGFLDALVCSRTTGLAAEMAFWLFLSLLPLAAVAGLVAARIAVGSADVAKMLASLPDQMRDLIAQQLEQVAAWNGGSVGASAAVIFMWLASGGVHAIFDLLELDTGCARPWWKKRLLALGTCVGLSVGVALIAVLGTGLDSILALFRGVVTYAPLASPISLLEKVIRFGVGVMTAVGLIAGLYWIGVPRRARHGTAIFPGAVLAVALQGISGYGYIFYLSKAGTGSAYQASLSIIGITMMALYLFSLALLVGAHLNHMLAQKGRAP